MHSPRAAQLARKSKTRVGLVPALGSVRKRRFGFHGGATSRLARVHTHRRLVRAHWRGYRQLSSAVRYRRSAFLRLRDDHRRAHHVADGRSPHSGQHAGRLRRRAGRCRGDRERHAAPDARRFPASSGQRARHGRAARSSAAARDRSRSGAAAHRRALPAARSTVRLHVARAFDRARRFAAALAARRHRRDLFRRRIPGPLAHARA